MRAQHRSRAGFTLIELLVVIAVIAILATAMLPMVSSAMNSQRRGKAAGEIAALMAGCERYRKLYGDFPCARAGTSTSAYTSDQPNYRRDFFLQLTGQQRLTSTPLAAGGIAVTLTTVTTARPIVSVETVTAGQSSKGGLTPTDLTLCDEFIDPWGNAYDYRYRVLNAATANTTTAPYITWLSPDCLIVSCGANFIESKVATIPHVPAPAEYWDLNATLQMPVRGTITTTYYEDLATGTPPYFRADNVTSWSGR